VSFETRRSTFIESLKFKLGIGLTETPEPRQPVARRCSGLRSTSARAVFSSRP